MRVIQFNGSDVREIDIDNTLEALRQAVRGNISIVELIPDHAVMVVNQDGRYHQMKPNIMASSIAGEKIAGPALAIGIDGRHFASLSPEIARHIKMRCNV